MTNKRNRRPSLNLIENFIPNTPEYLQIGILMDKTQVVLKNACAKDQNIPLGKTCTH